MSILSDKLDNTKVIETELTKEIAYGQSLKWLVDKNIDVRLNDLDAGLVVGKGRHPYNVKARDNVVEK